MPDDKMKNKNLVASVTNTYIRKIKKWMFCPNCHDGKLIIDNRSAMWNCKNCGYQISADEFEDNHSFWFCDKCGAFLNNQQGFAQGAERHICGDCGFENSITAETQKGICSGCGKIIFATDTAFCPGCQQKREQKAKEWIAKAGKVVGVATAVVGAAAYLASQIGSDGCEEEAEGGSHDSDWLKAASEDELRARKKEITESTDWRSGSILDGDFDEEIEALDAIDEEINQRAWDQYNSEDHSNENYGVHREHGWYLPNDD